VCQKPYEGFYLGCESCEGWFHPPCIGLSETEANRFDTNPDAVFLCPECSSSSSSSGGGKSKGKKKDEVVKEKAEASKSTTPLKVKDTE
jgi:hypothetical protein